jgi:hypothetical protein
MLFIYALFLGPLFSLAKSLDQDLSFYIEQMNLKALPSPTPKREALVLDRRPETMDERSKNLAQNLPRNLGLEIEEKKDLYCFLMVALTDIKNQKDLLKKGVLDEIQDCSPRSYL